MNGNDKNNLHKMNDSTDNYTNSNANHDGDNNANQQQTTSCTQKTIQNINDQYQKLHSLELLLYQQYQTLQKEEKYLRKAIHISKERGGFLVGEKGDGAVAGVETRNMNKNDKDRNIDTVGDAHTSNVTMSTVGGKGNTCDSRMIEKNYVKESFAKKKKLLDMEAIQRLENALMGDDSSSDDDDSSSD